MFMPIVNGLIGTEDNAIAKTSNCKQDYYMDLAAREALKSDMTQKHGCVILLDDEILSIGHNYRTTHMFHTFSIHAEIDALNKINKKKYKAVFHKMEMYVVRIGTGKFSNVLKYSKPCQGCTNAILKYGIQKVYYSTNWEYEELLRTSVCHKCRCCPCRHDYEQ